MAQKQETERGGEKVAWDMGSPLYDSYEVASLGRLLDRHLTVMDLPFHDGSLQREVVFRDEPRKSSSSSKKVTVRALFRAVASCMIRP